MSLQDVLKVKKLADNISFLRLFYLKSNSEHILQAQKPPTMHTTYSGKNSHTVQTLDIIDCIMAICFFELSRVFKSGRVITSKHDVAFKIVHYFSNLKLAKEIDAKTKVDFCRKESVLTQVDEEDEDS
jgi:hypothetical protein